MKAVTDLVAVLRTHAPHSVTNINTGGGASFAGSVNTGGGAVVAGGVNTGGGAFVRRDQRITNVTVHGIDEVDKLVAVLREGFGDLVRNPDAPTLERVSAVLDEISKLYQLMDSEMTRYLSLTLDNLGHDRKELLDLDGGKVTVRASEARGHCSRIDALYRGTLRPWFVDRLSRDQMTTLDQSFSALGHSDRHVLCHRGAGELALREGQRHPDPDRQGRHRRREARDQGRAHRGLRSAAEADRDGQPDARHSGGSDNGSRLKPGVAPSTNAAVRHLADDLQGSDSTYRCRASPRSFL